MTPSLVFGVASVGYTASGTAYTFDTAEKVSELLALLQRLNIKQIDSSAVYPSGNTWHAETLLGESQAAEKGFIIDSKVLYQPDVPFLDDKGISASIDRTLELLGTRKIGTYYAHAPDPNTPLEEQTKAFQKQYLAGKSEPPGLSNYTVDDMAKFFDICDEKGYVKPAVYQGHYTALYRKREDDGMLALLRKHNCAFFAFSPLAGGFLTGKVTLASSNSKTLEQTRWETVGGRGTWYSGLFDTPAMHEAILVLKAVCDAASPQLSLQGAVMRWMIHHSTLRCGRAKASFFGAKRLDQLEANVADARGDPLEGAVLDAVEGMWASVREKQPSGQKL
ncbi:NADP-dependent oxidoreductase domain-containing protein [Apodospora peruviana]|uniref:NADP-dependent oxidoreductase domain-containing protein n=1 Tax=Apodospora peruviana TaxID=516989 RepID=A0AAE0M504_9PEZI|nr:NADP-dependent oxidoreductase domain-containing protein [Apodospora peruviana]